MVAGCRMNEDEPVLMKVNPNSFRGVRSCFSCSSGLRIKALQYEPRSPVFPTCAGAKALRAD
jgi:hypothetical protein